MISVYLSLFEKNLSLSQAIERQIIWLFNGQLITTEAIVVWFEVIPRKFPEKTLAEIRTGREVRSITAWKQMLAVMHSHSRQP
jgi:hypothetical protein